MESTQQKGRQQGPTKETEKLSKEPQEATRPQAVEAQAKREIRQKRHRVPVCPEADQE
jgi:hypothetical protein